MVAALALERLGGGRDPNHRRRPFKGRLTGADLLGGAPLGEWIGVLCDQAGAIFRVLDARSGLPSPTSFRLAGSPRSRETRPESTEDWPRKASAAAGPAVYRWRALQIARGVRAIRDAGRALVKSRISPGHVLAARPRVPFGDGRQNARRDCGRLAPKGNSAHLPSLSACLAAPACKYP
jgi:hypothetical protein